jgi:hypothetical protein
VDLPVKLVEGDKHLLAALRKAVNSGANDSPARGKFQRRAARVLNYANLRVPGLPTGSNDSSAQGAADQGSRDTEFDRMDQSAANIMELGLEPTDTGIGVFKDRNVVEFSNSFDAVKDLRDFMSNPERVFSALPERRSRFDCLDLGLAADARDRNSRLDDLCLDGELLPPSDLIQRSFSTVDELGDEILGAVAEIGETLDEVANETPTQRRGRFCATKLGRRNAFDKYCRRN